MQGACVKNLKPLPQWHLLAKWQKCIKRRNNSFIYFFIFFLTHGVQNVIIDSKTNSYTSNTPMHFSACWMMNSWVLHSVVEATATETVASWEFRTFQTWMHHWYKVRHTLEMDYNWYSTRETHDIQFFFLFISTCTVLSVGHVYRMKEIL